MALALVAPTGALMRLRGGGAMPRNIENSLIKDDLAALQKALEQGTLDGESVTKEGNSAMHLVCRHGARSCLDALLEAGVGDVDARRPSDGGTPLMYASQNGHLPCAERLLRAGAAVNLQQVERTAALHYAARHGHEAIVSLLLAVKGVDVNAQRVDGVTPLMVAAFNDHTPIVDALLRAKADAACRSNEDLAALDYTAREGHAASAASLLKAKGVKRDAGADSKGGTAPVHWAADGGHATCLATLLDGGCKPDTARAADGSVALHYASLRGRDDCVRVLLAAGADARRARSSDGATPLHMAAQAGAVNCIELLLGAGADVNAAVANAARGSMVASTTPLDLAEAGKHKPSVAALRRAGGVSGAQLAVAAEPMAEPVTQ